MKKEELLVSLNEKIEAQIPLRLDAEYGELILTATKVLFIVPNREHWIFRREWKKIALSAWSLRSGVFGKKLILYFKLEIMIFHQPPADINFWKIFSGIDVRLSSWNDGYWQYYLQKALHKKH